MYFKQNKIILFFLIMMPTYCWGQDITFFPFKESFDETGYKTFISTTCQLGGARLDNIEGDLCYGGFGRCIKLIPPSSNGQCSLGIGPYALPPNTKKLNIRVLIKIGNQYEETARSVGYNYQNKMFLVLRSEASQRGMSIFEKRGDSFWFTFGACEDNSCRYQDGTETGYAWPHQNDTFKSSLYSDQWVCVEIELDLNEQTSNTYIWTADGKNNGLHIAYTPYPEGGGIGYYTNIQAIGGFFNGYHVANENAYLMFDELVIDNKFIGPPLGFMKNIPGTPYSPSGLKVIK
jgi:hypothetical protein